MKKLFLSILTFCAISFSIHLQAQCTPDTSMHTSGTKPYALDTAETGKPYTQVIHYYMTADTLIYIKQLNQTVNAHIDTLWITSVTGLPPGISYTCHNPECKITGGSSGCATLAGTPASGSGGIYPLVVNVKIRATAFLGPVPVAQTAYDSIVRYAIVVQYPAGVATVAGAGNMIAYPNPAQNNLQVYAGVAGNVTYTLTDVKGVTVKQGSWESGVTVQEIQTQDFARGIYILKTETREGMNYLRIILE